MLSHSHTSSLCYIQCCAHMLNCSFVRMTSNLFKQTEKMCYSTNNFTDNKWAEVCIFSVCAQLWFHRHTVKDIHVQTCDVANHCHHNFNDDERQKCELIACVVCNKTIRILSLFASQLNQRVTKITAKHWNIRRGKRATQQWVQQCNFYCFHSVHCVAYCVVFHVFWGGGVGGGDGGVTAVIVILQNGQNSPFSSFFLAASFENSQLLLNGTESKNVHKQFVKWHFNLYLLTLSTIWKAWFWPDNTFCGFALFFSALSLCMKWHNSVTAKNACTFFSSHLPEKKITRICTQRSA